jgi:hypothetical protein
VSWLTDPSFMDLRVDRKDGVVRTARSKHDGGPLAGARASVETGADLSRFTATRVALLGPFALAFKKKRQQAFLMVEGDGWALVREVDRKDGLAARKFAAAVNAAGARAAAA